MAKKSAKKTKKFATISFEPDYGGLIVFDGAVDDRGMPLREFRFGKSKARQLLHSLEVEGVTAVKDALKKVIDGQVS